MNKFILAVNFLWLATISFGQMSGLPEEPKPKDRFFIGGGMDLALNNEIFVIGASPSLGYMITQSTSVGVGVTYQLYNYRVANINTDVYGYRFFLMQRLVSNFFAYAEYENLSYEENVFTDNSPRFWNQNVYAGAGLYQPLTRRSGFLMMALYNFMYQNKREAINPWSFRAGITFNPFVRD